MDVQTQQDLQQRFSQLAQRSFRLKISILLLILVSLFAVWSTLTNGSAKAEQVDIAFCNEIIKDPYYGPVEIRGDYSCDPATMLAYTIHDARHHHDDDAPYPSTLSPQDLTERIRNWLGHVKQFRDYDWNRRQAYRIELSLPYTKSADSLNGSLISYGWPFCALLALSVAITLGFKQTCYEMNLSALITRVESKADSGREFALTEFMATDISEVRSDGRLIFLYKRPIALYPEIIVSGVLFGAVSLLSLNLLTDYTPQFSERGYELFGDYYYIALYLFFVVLFLLLLRTRRLWRSSVHNVVGGEVKSARLFFLYKFQRFLHDKSVAGVRLETALVSLCAGLGLVSLFLSWGDSYRGFVLLCCPMRFFDDEPITGRLLQLQMLIAVVFLIAELVSRLPTVSRRRQFHVALTKVRVVVTWPVILFSGFILFYAFIGIYGFVKDLYLWPVLDAYNPKAVENLQYLPTLGDADFSLGFTTFVATCGILALHEVCPRSCPE